MIRIIKVIGFALICLPLNGCASLVDRLINAVRLKPPYIVDPDTRRLHQQLLIIDMHADTLLWNRDILERSSYGHVDVPRLQEAHVGLQFFSVVTGVPLFISLDNNSDRPDMISQLARMQDWPGSTWSSRMERAVYQAQKLLDRVHASAGGLKLITNRRELEELLEARDRGESVIGALLSLEGVHALEGKLDNLDRLYELGFRAIGLSHFFDNEMAGSAHGKKKYGLKPLGRELVRRAQARGMIIDLAHASQQAIDDTLAIVDRPVIVSHTGVRATCDSVRNLHDHHVRAIAEKGGLIGIGLFKYATCGKTIEDTVRAIRHVANLVGIEHVALGSDFDGSKTVVDASGLTLLTQALIKNGFTEQEIAAVMGDNVLRVLRQTLPQN
jgi:membrane dipeptidase